jgi:hypothetical protein
MDRVFLFIIASSLLAIAGALALLVISGLLGPSEIYFKTP